MARGKKGKDIAKTQESANSTDALLEKIASGIEDMLLKELKKKLKKMRPEDYVESAYEAQPDKILGEMTDLDKRLCTIIEAGSDLSKGLGNFGLAFLAIDIVQRSCAERFPKVDPEKILYAKGWKIAERHY